MADWLKSMQQTFEYYVVDPGTWKDVKLLDKVKSCSITRDAEAETLGSATFDVTESIGECYIRVYLVTVQNGVRERHPLGTFLAQTPSSSFDGKIHSMSVDAYTPLIELKENRPPLGYALLEGENIMDAAYRLIREHARAPVVKTVCEEKLPYDFVSNTDDTWLTFIIDLITIAKYTLALDELGRILFAPVQELSSLQPVWTYDDNNSSILYPELTMDYDLYGIPNVIDVTYSDETNFYHKRVVNDDPNSPVSTISRGREIVSYVSNPAMNGIPTEAQIEEYAKQLLEAASNMEHSVSYSHGYCPTRLDDCIRLNYSRAGVDNVKGKVIHQSIKCEPGCPVSEKAVYTTKIWR